MHIFGNLVGSIEFRRKKRACVGPSGGCISSTAACDQYKYAIFATRINSYSDAERTYILLA